MPKDKIWFLRVCHHISNAVYQAEEMKKVKSKIVVKDILYGVGGRVHGKLFICRPNKKKLTTY